MGRDIRFKAWDYRYNVMVPSVAVYQHSDHIGFDLDLAETIYSNEVLESDDGHIYGGEGEWVFMMNEFELLQYIGIQDNFHEDIFDGDLVKTTQGSIFQVLWDQGECGWILLCLNGEWRGRKCELKAIFDVNLEVIGNIYENPELVPK